jgi:hypothetical protein
LSFTTIPSTFTPRSLQEYNQHTGIPGGAWELAAGDGSPELADKRHGREIEITVGLLEAVAGSGITPMSPGGEAVAAGAAMARNPARP